MRPHTNGVLETSLYVDDVARSAAFYEKIFGFQKLGELGQRGCAIVVLVNLQRATAYTFGVLAERFVNRSRTERPRPSNRVSVHVCDLRDGQTQIQRALNELGIGWIGAHSPQAKGRVERESVRTRGVARCAAVTGAITQVCRLQHHEQRLQCERPEQELASALG